MEKKYVNKATQTDESHFGAVPLYTERTISSASTPSDKTGKSQKDVKKDISSLADNCKELWAKYEKMKEDPNVKYSNKILHKAMDSQELFVNTTQVENCLKQAESSISRALSKNEIRENLENHISNLEKALKYKENFDKAVKAEREKYPWLEETRSELQTISKSLSLKIEGKYVSTVHNDDIASNLKYMLKSLNTEYDEAFEKTAVSDPAKQQEGHNTLYNINKDYNNFKERAQFFQKLNTQNNAFEKIAKNIKLGATEEDKGKIKEWRDYHLKAFRDAYSDKKELSSSDKENISKTFDAHIAEIKEMKARTDNYNDMKIAMDDLRKMEGSIGNLAKILKDRKDVNQNALKAFLEKVVEKVKMANKLMETAQNPDACKIGDTKKMINQEIKDIKISIGKHLADIQRKCREIHGADALKSQVKQTTNAFDLYKNQSTYAADAEFESSVQNKKKEIEKLLNEAKNFERCPIGSETNEGLTTLQAAVSDFTHIIYEKIGYPPDFSFGNGLKESLEAEKKRIEDQLKYVEELEKLEEQARKISNSIEGNMLKLQNMPQDLEGDITGVPSDLETRYAQANWQVTCSLKEAYDPKVKDSEREGKKAALDKAVIALNSINDEIKGHLPPSYEEVNM